MNIITVVPISRGRINPELSYFTSANLKLGSIILVPVRNQTLPALVLKVTAASQLKTGLKKLDYPLKNINPQTVRANFPASLITASTIVADEMALPLGQTLAELIPKTILENIGSETAVAKTSLTKTKPSTKTEINVLQASDDERFTFYKGLIREAFAKKQSVILVSPTHEGLERLRPTLAKGLENYTFIIHGKLTKKKFLTAWQKAETENHPVLILGTAMALTLPRPDLGLIIIDDEHDHTYRTRSHLALDWRVFAQALAQTTGSRLIFGSAMLRLTSIYQVEAGHWQAAAPIPYHMPSIASTTVIDHRKNKAALTTEVINCINQAPNEHFFLLTGRRGLAPTTMCSDCGSIITCTRCGQPLVLHTETKNQNQRYFECHHCGQTEVPIDACKNCGSWRLTALGWGSETITAELQKTFPERKIFRLDRDNTTTGRQRQIILKEFLVTPGALLVGTEIALHQLTERIENTIALGIDSWFMVPDFTARENIFRNLLALRDKALKKCLIQTRNYDDSIFKHIKEGNLIDFCREELAERKQWHYPPFTSLLTISTRNNATSEASFNQVLNLLKNYEPTHYEIGEGNNTERVILLRRPSNTPLPPALVEIIRALPPTFTTRVNPDSLV